MPGGGSAKSSLTGTADRLCEQEWEKPEVDPKMVSSELEAMLAERFPELSPLLLETSFSNKQAPWRQQGRAGSNSPSRAGSLSVSRAGSITQPNR